jgi:hypothetical protein
MSLRLKSLERTSVLKRSKGLSKPFLCTRRSKIRDRKLNKRRKKGSFKRSLLLRSSLDLLRNGCLRNIEKKLLLRYSNRGKL